MQTDIQKSPSATHASIRIFGEGLDFEAVSRGIGFPPSGSHRKGDRDLIGRAFDKDMWRLDSPLSPTEPLDAHLKVLRTMLSPRNDFLRSIKEFYEVSSYVGLTITGNAGQFSVSAESLRLWVELAISMELGIVFVNYTDLQSTPTTMPPAQSELASAAFLEIRGGISDWEPISRWLEVQPIKIDRSGNGDADTMSYQLGLWSFDCPPTHFGNVDAQLKWLGAKLLPRIDVIGSLGSSNRLAIHCNLKTAKDITELSVSAEALKTCTALGIPLLLTIKLII